MVGLFGLLLTLLQTVHLLLARRKELTIRIMMNFAVSQAVELPEPHLQTVILLARLWLLLLCFQRVHLQRVKLRLLRLIRMLCRHCFLLD